MMTRWYSGMAEGAGRGWEAAPQSTGVKGDMTGLADGGPFQSCCVGIFRDKDWDRIILKLVFLRANDKEKWEISAADWDE